MTDVKLVKDCGLYPSYKKIIDFTGTKSEIIRKQLTWIDSFEHLDIPNVNYNKFQNKLTLPLDYEEALTYTYAVLENISGTDDKPMFFFINEIANLSNDLEVEPNIAISLSLDPIMTYMGDWKLDECMVNYEHKDRWANNKPIRLTPNQDGLTAFNKTVESLKLESSLPENLALCVITFTSPYLKIKFDAPEGFVYHWDEVTKEMDNAVYYGCFLVDLDDANRQVKTRIKGLFHGVTEDVDIPEPGSGIAKFPSLNQIVDGDFQSLCPIVDNAIVSFTLTSACFLDISYERVGNEYIYSFGDIPNFSVKIYQERSTTNPEITVNSLGWLELSKEAIHYEIQAQRTISLDDKLIVVFKDIRDIDEDKKSIRVDISKWMLPEQPNDNSLASPKHEPALFMSPYITRKIVKGDGTTILEIPDVDFTENELTLRTIITANGISNVFIHGDENIQNISEGEYASDNSVILDVVNDEWKTYVYTKRDTDRQVTANYAWKNAIDNLIYMSYGGALVGSRSISEQPFYQKGFEGLHSYGWVDYNSGYKNPLSYPGHDVPGHLTKYGKRVASAVGLAAGASIVTSLVDAHVAWENQMQKEKQIRNEPTTLQTIGDGIETVLAGYKDYYYITQKVDDINYNRAYERFKKYGYLINKFEIPDIKSRKYFNYLLTNGAIVNGSINQGIRDVIASIFDAGVTIFHYDSGDAKTRKLEYTEKENIETSLINPGSVSYTFPPLDDDHSITAVIEHE